MKPEWDKINGYWERYTMDEWDSLEDSQEDLKKIKGFIHFIKYMLDNFKIENDWSISEYTQDYETEFEEIFLEDYYIDNDGEYYGDDDE